MWGRSVVSLILYKFLAKSVLCIQDKANDAADTLEGNDVRSTNDIGSNLSFDERMRARVQQQRDKHKGPSSKLPQVPFILWKYVLGRFVCLDRDFSRVDIHEPLRPSRFICLALNV